MVLLSGEVETLRVFWLRSLNQQGSGWFCYPGKLKLLALQAVASAVP